MIDLPEITQQRIIHINATPDANYVLRILKAYRQNCDCRWAESTEPYIPTTDPLFLAMNKHCEERAILLDRAIAILEKY